MEYDPDPHGGEPSTEPEHQREQRPNQRFHFGPWVFNIDEAQALLSEHPREPQALPVALWARFYGLDDRTRHEHAISLIGPGPNFDPDYALTTDLGEPVIVAMLHSTDYDEDFPLLIDGTHRLYRAHQEGVTELPAYVLTVEESLAVRQEQRYR